MPFTFLTRAELDRRETELKNEVRRSQAMLEEWYEKFQRLHARLSKRVKDAVEADAAAPSAERPSDGNGAPPSTRTVRSMRGF